ncbi:MAG: cyclase family protein [Candidatus Freyarchaeota archaeon]
MKPKKIVDLTRKLDPTDPNWAKDPQWGATIPEEEIKIEPYIFVHDRCLCEWIRLWSHAGTHIEAPYHGYMVNSDVTIGDVPIETFVGEGYAIDLSFVGEEPDLAKKMERYERFSVSGPMVTREHIKQYEQENNIEIREGDIVLFYTNMAIPDIPVISSDAAAYLIEKKIKLVGTNDETIIYSSMAHMSLLQANIPLIEMLTNLDKLGKGRVTIIALPLYIKGIGGSPARVIAITDWEE